MADHYTKQRPVGYFNGLLTGTRDQFLKLLKKYSVSPPDDANALGWDEKGTIGVKNMAPITGYRMLNTTRNDHIRLNQIQDNKRVAYINLKLQGRGPGAGRAGDSVYFEISYQQTNTWVPVYFLPWDQRGAAVRITIPRMGVNNPDPNVFFTAAINGCSIFFQGDQETPTIYHCGGSTGHDDITASAEFWEEVTRFYLAKDVNLGQNLGVLAQERIDKRNYITEVGVTLRQNNEFGQMADTATTRLAKEYAQKLNRFTLFDKFTIETVNPWACVCGWRDDKKQWTFYLQENANVQYFRIDKTTRRTIRRIVARPLRVTEIWPKGRAHVTVRGSIPKIM